MDTIRKRTKTSSGEAVDSIVLLLWLSGLCIFYLLRNFLEAFYVSSKRKRPNLLTSEFVINFVSMVVWVVGMIRYYGSWSKVSVDDLPGGETDFENAIVLEQIWADSTYNIYILVALLVSIQWTRSIFIF